MSRNYTRYNDLLGFSAMENMGNNNNVDKVRTSH